MDEIDKDCSRLFKYNMQREFVQRNFCDFAAQGNTDRAQKTWDRIEQDNYSHEFSS